MCVCVRRQKRKGDRQREICLIKEAKQAQTRNRQWQDWKLGALGGHQRLYKWMCVCVWEGGYCWSILWLYSNCVFLLLISPSCWKAKYSLCAQMLTDVLCTIWLPLKLTYTHKHKRDSNTYPSCAPSRDSSPWLAWDTQQIPQHFLKSTCALERPRSTALFQMFYK